MDERKIVFECVTAFGDRRRMEYTFPAEITDEQIDEYAYDCAVDTAHYFITHAKEKFEEEFENFKFDSEDEYYEARQEFLANYYALSTCMWIEETIEVNGEKYEECRFCMS